MRVDPRGVVSEAIVGDGGGRDAELFEPTVAVLFELVVVDCRVVDVVDKSAVYREGRARSGAPCYVFLKSNTRGRAVSNETRKRGKGERVQSTH